MAVNFRIPHLQWADFGAVTGRISCTSLNYSTPPRCMPMEEFQQGRFIHWEPIPDEEAILLFERGGWGPLRLIRSQVEALIKAEQKANRGCDTLIQALQEMIW